MQTYTLLRGCRRILYWEYADVYFTERMQTYTLLRGCRRILYWEYAYVYFTESMHTYTLLKLCRRILYSEYADVYFTQSMQTYSCMYSGGRYETTTMLKKVMRSLTQVTSLYRRSCLIIQVGVPAVCLSAALISTADFLYDNNALLKVIY